MKIEGEYTTADVKTDELEEGAVEQIQEMANHEAFQNPIKIMPDAHWGKGAVIGFTMPFEDRVVPNTVGVDIGCGMSAVSFGSHVEFTSYEDVDQKVRDAVPMGFDVHINNNYHMGDDFPWDELNDVWFDFIQSFEPFEDVAIETRPFGLEYFRNLCDRVGYDMSRAINSVGSLGGGNHFIEFNRGSDGNIWCVIHSGSRGIGLKIAEYWQEKATANTTSRKSLDDVPDDVAPYLDENWKPKADRIRDDFEGENIQRMFDRVSQTIQEYGPGSENRNTDLDYLEGEEAIGYLRDMLFAQRYASESRWRMLELVRDSLNLEIHDAIESVHNYIDFEDQIIRKGATRAHEGEYAIIPFNMADGTILIEGKGNSDWNYSAPHGAGRRMGRRDAHRNLTVEEFEKRMEGVFNFNDKEEILDEAPMAYKDIAIIMEVIEETGEVVDTWKPVINIKAE